MTDHASTTRFSSRVEDYIRHRPGYPGAAITLLRDTCSLTQGSQIVDVGSGTGILTRLLLEQGYAVTGVEPNAEMRHAAERLLATYPRFTSVDGTAEAIPLPSHSADLVVAAQAFHWFDRPRARAEFLRTLRPGGWAALLWNDRRVDSSPFLVGYEAALQEFGTDYNEVNHKNVQDPSIIQAFLGGPVTTARFDNHQHFDLEGLVGRVASSSYCPPRGTAAFDALRARLSSLFSQHARRGAVTFEYDTVVSVGQMR